MPTKSPAAVLFKRGEPLRIETIDVADPGPGEVLIRHAATGLCHSDLHLFEEKVHPAMDYALPLVAGHEGFGVVAAAGAGVHLREGDTVMPYLMPDCGECIFCKSGRTNLCVQAGRSARPDAKSCFTLGGRSVTAARGTAAFSQYVCVPEDQVVKVNPKATAVPCCCIGCAVATGAGAVLLVAKVHPGSSVIVFGAGGVGLSVIQGASMAGAATIIAVDLEDEKEGVAMKMGATHFFNAACPGLQDEVTKLTGIGADFAFDTVGGAAVTRQALSCLHRGGWAQMVRLGMDMDPDASLTVSELAGVTCRSSIMGGAKRSDVARFVDWWVEGKLNLDGLVSHQFPLERINEGFDLMREGKGARTVVLFD